MGAEHDWRRVAADQRARLVRFRVALLILRAWSGVSDERSSDITAVIYRWIDSGMDGPVPWPDDTAFGRWAARNGLGQVNGHVISHWFTAEPASGTVH